MIKVQHEDFNQQIEYDRLRQASHTGAVVTFTGLVRDINQGEQITALTLEHYPAMTEKALADIVEQAKSRWSLINATVIHRVGELQLLDQIVFVGNTMIDTLLANQKRLEKPSFFDKLDLQKGKYITMTLHRPRNVEDAATLTKFIKNNT